MEPADAAPHPILWAAKPLTYRRMGASVGQTLLDVGCGPGTDTIPLAGLVGPSGRVVGIDRDPSQIAVAARAAKSAGVDAWTHHLSADAAQLPFADGVFDGVRCERVLIHLEHPESAIGEMVRVTRPGGRLVLLDPDLGSLSIDMDDADLGWRLRRAESDMMPNGFSGRRLYGQAVRAGLVQITAEVLPLVIARWALAKFAVLDQVTRYALERRLVTAEEVQSLYQSMARRDGDGQFFAYGIQVLVGGQKPAGPRPRPGADWTIPPAETEK